MYEILHISMFCVDKSYFNAILRGIICLGVYLIGLAKMKEEN
jgi:hypothetical protein